MNETMTLPAAAQRSPVSQPIELISSNTCPFAQRTRMVLITKDLPEAFVQDLFAAFTGVPGIDRPDRQAMTDNPLAVSGLRF